MPLAPQSFLYQHDPHHGVATITLNRPDRLNALTFDVYRELRDAFRTLDDEPGVRAVIITGAGRAFCSGGDVEDIIGALFARDDAGLLEFTRLTCDLILAMRQCRRPVVGALNGTVAGAGAVIAAACDVRIAAESAKIAFLFTKVGLSGADMGAAWLSPTSPWRRGPRTTRRAKSPPSPSPPTTPPRGRRRAISWHGSARRAGSRRSQTRTCARRASCARPWRAPRRSRTPCSRSRPWAPCRSCWRARASSRTAGSPPSSPAGRWRRSR